ncbi:hypothetical protein N0V90_007369 [Kalmusia sp. IMI 367209]|nr:hypothetical protein N0V90_007369 [Kalmusia sp. IMI 367209]
MSSTTGRGTQRGNKLNLNSTSEIHNNMISMPKLARPSRSVYPAAPGEPDSDELIREIPSPEQAFSDFQSVPSGQMPWRDVPSIIIAHLSNPQTSGVEPSWQQLLQHFTLEDKALDGEGNLQDL